MIEKKDISSTEDIKVLVYRFYDQIRVDDILGPIFNNSISNWDEHLPKMVAFWDNILFQKPGFKGNPMQSHRKVNSNFELDKAKFDHWLNLFRQTLDHHFKGVNTERAYNKAVSIATVTQIKLQQLNNIY